MHQLDLQDSIIEGVEPWNVNYKNATDFIRAVEELKKQFASGKVDCIHLCNYGNSELGDSPIDVAITSYTSLHYSTVPDKCSFTTSHYIGYWKLGGLNTHFTSFRQPVLILSRICGECLPTCRRIWPFTSRR